MVSLFFLGEGNFPVSCGRFKGYQKHENIQDTMEKILICISIAAVILAVILFSALR